MDRIYRAFFPVLIIIAACAAGLRAQDLKDYGVVRLPEISTAAASLITSCGLVVSIVDEKGVVVPVKHYEMTWQKGAWQDVQRGIPLAQLLFPIRLVVDKHISKPRYRLDYSVTYAAGSARPSVKFTDYLPTDGPEPFVANAVFPFDVITVDAGDLKFTGQGADPGLRMVKSTVSRTIGGSPRKESAAFTQKTPQTDAVLFDRGTRATAEIFFLCNYKGKMIQLPWDDNGKPLPSLNLRLAQPDCPQ